MYTCHCDPGYLGTNCEIENNPCDEDPCLNDSRCEKLTVLVYKCHCLEGFKGENCETAPINWTMIIGGGLVVVVGAVGAYFFKKKLNDAGLKKYQKNPVKKKRKKRKRESSSSDESISSDSFDTYDRKRRAKRRKIKRERARKRRTKRKKYQSESESDFSERDDKKKVRIQNPLEKPPEAVFDKSAASFNGDNDDVKFVENISSHFKESRSNSMISDFSMI